jgi:hypothetical protein
MASSILFFVLTFRQIGQSQAGQSQYQVDAAIRASSAEEACASAEQMARCGRGTVAFSIAGDPSKGAWGEAEVLARFGNVPDDHALRQSIVPA